MVKLGPQTFSLSAVHQETVGLSKEDANPVTVGMVPASLNPGISQTNAMAATQPLQRPRAETLPGQALEEDRPNSYIEEYQVDWAPWVAKLATRWHRNLRLTEELFGLQFQTPQPALIQFTCYADGHIGNLILKQSSGIVAYDKIQIAALAHTQPLPAFPKGTQRRSVTLVQGWESHCKRPGEEEFVPWNFATKYPKEIVSRWQRTY